MKQQWIWIAVCVAALSCATSYLPRSNSRADVQRYVEEAAKLVRAHGAGACDALASAKWRNDGYYVFVTNADTHVTLCHARPDVAGRNDYDLQDVNGKYFVREMLAIAKEQPGGGWVEYMWPRVEGGAPALKSTFVVGVRASDGTTYAVGSGGYDLAP